MLTKVGQLFEEEKLEYARKAVLQAKKEADEALLQAKKEADKALLLAKVNAEKEAKKEEKKHTIEKMIRKGFSNGEILDIIDGVSEADVDAIRNEMEESRSLS